MKGNDSKQEVLGSVVRYMGLAVLGIVAINPSKEELKQLLNLDEDPKETMYTYTDIVTKDKEGNEKTSNKVKIWLRGANIVKTDKLDEKGQPVFAKEVITASYDVFVSERPDIASTGSPKTLNALGAHTYQSVEKIEANENMAWLSKHKPLYQAREGEAELLTFFREFLNLGAKDEAMFKDYLAIAKGNVTELKNYAKAWSNNGVVCLLGANVKDEGKVYQALYNKCFSRPSAKNPKEKFSKALNENYGEFKAVYPSDLVLQYYIPNVDAPDSNAPGTSAPTTSGNGWV